MLHLLTKSYSDTNDQVQAYQSAKHLFTVNSMEWKLNILGAPDGCSFELPLLPNVHGNTALDICLGIQKQRATGIFLPKTKTEEKVQKALNIAMAEVIFEGITPYGFMHSSSFTVYAVNFALGLGLESIKNYLESRLQEV